MCNLISTSHKLGKYDMLIFIIMICYVLGLPNFDQIFLFNALCKFFGWATPSTNDCSNIFKNTSQNKLLI